MCDETRFHGLTPSIAGVTAGVVSAGVVELGAGVVVSDAAGDGLGAGVVESVAAGDGLGAGAVESVVAAGDGVDELSATGLT